MTEVIKMVSGEEVVTATTAEEMKADFLNRVEKMYDFVKGMDGVLGEGACHVLSIRPQGGVEMEVR